MSAPSLKVVAGGGAVGARRVDAPSAEAANRWLERRMKSVLVLEYTSDFGAVRLATVREGAEPSELDRMLAIAERALAPAPAEVVEAELGRLYLTTSGRGKSENELAAQLRFYKEDLEIYPSDIVRAACRNGWKWWPSVGELVEVAEGLIALRRSIARALRNGPGRPHQADPEWERPTPAEIQRVDDIVARFLGREPKPAAAGDAVPIESPS